MPELSPMEKIVVGEFAERTRALLGWQLSKLVLFGSRARGDGHEDSDLDVLVLVRSLDGATRRRIEDLASDLLLERELRVSPLVRDADAFDARTPIARAISRDGVAL